MPVDLFANLGRPDAQLHPQYLTLRDSPAYAPARGIIRELQQEFLDPDGNFVEQFQTTGFDSRTFELFLFALFKESGHTIDRSQQRPDFLLTKDGITAAVEAVTASAPTNEGLQPYLALPNMQSRDDLVAYLHHNLPIRLGSPLFSKLRARYWLEPHVRGRPFVIAIEDFHGPGSLTNSSAPLSNYLFGFRQNWYHDAEGKLVVTGEATEFHQQGSKRIPSGFFNQPEAENISAVLFCNSGTVPKFARMGQEGAHRSTNVRMIRHGSCYQHDPNATLPNGFVYEVGAERNGRELWREGTVLIHNPRALMPLVRGWLGAGVEERSEEGQVIATFSEPFLPYSSMTMMFPGNMPGRDFDRVMRQFRDAIAKIFPMA